MCEINDVQWNPSILDTLDKDVIAYTYDDLYQIFGEHFIVEGVELLNVQHGIVV